MVPYTIEERSVRVADTNRRSRLRVPRCSELFEYEQGFFFFGAEVQRRTVALDIVAKLRERVNSAERTLTVEKDRLKEYLER